MPKSPLARGILCGIGINLIVLGATAAIHAANRLRFPDPSDPQQWGFYAGAVLLFPALLIMAGEYLCFPFIEQHFPNWVRDYGTKVRSAEALGIVLIILGLCSLVAFLAGPQPFETNSIRWTSAVVMILLSIVYSGFCVYINRKSDRFRSAHDIFWFVVGNAGAVASLIVVLFSVVT
jgi:hypothetical protein